MERRRVEEILRGGMRLLTVSVPCLLLAVTGILVWKSLPILEGRSLPGLLLGSAWVPSEGEFGFYPFLAGTLIVTALAMLVSVPLSLLSAVYLSEYAGARVRGAVKPLIDLLSGIPSVVYGLWGTSLVVPLIRDSLGPFFGVRTTGYSVLAGGLVLALMVFPITISVMEEVFRAIPQAMRETSLVLGATRWETVKYVVLRRGYPGVFAAVILGFSRAFGETMAVLMVVGNVARVPGSVFDPAFPLPSLIANYYGEMMSLPLYDSALMFSALILLVVVGGFSVAARVIQRRVYLRYR